MLRTNRLEFLLLAVLLATTGGSCADPGRDLPIGTYERARAEYDGRHWAAAIEDFKIFVRRNPRDARADSAQFFVGRSYFESKEYPVAAVEFEILRQDHPASPLVEDAFYWEGLCLRKQVPSHRVDQTVTVRALDRLREYTRSYPDGHHRDEASAMIAELEYQLARKLLDEAELYDRLRKPSAVAIVLDKLLTQYPTTELRPRVLLLRGDAALDQGEDDAARRYWSQLLQESPDHDLAGRARTRLAELDEDQDTGR